MEEAQPNDLFEAEVSDTEKEALLKKLETEPNSELSGNPLVIGQALLQVLKDMPEPLLGFQAYDSFLMLQYIQKDKGCYHKNSSYPPKDKLDITRLYLKSLPVRPKAIVYQLFSLLTKISCSNPSRKGFSLLTKLILTLRNNCQHIWTSSS